jgi:lipopolysaccharide/colanic/teichoic acid biosynthesis glycosyltransferase
VRALRAKRCVDVLSACIALVVFAPLLVLIALAVAVFIGHPVFFTQVRPGLLGRPFKMVKFRSMSDERGASGELLPDALRLSRFGKFLRASSLDELPELWNVLKGDMSLVGPRPLLMEYLPLYTQEQARRHEVRPGMTGWAQVNGRNALSWEERFALDVWYVENVSWLLDLRILGRTIHKVIAREGISHRDEVSMSKFRGC